MNQNEKRVQFLLQPIISVLISVQSDRLDILPPPEEEAPPTYHEAITETGADGGPPPPDLPHRPTSSNTC